MCPRCIKGFLVWDSDFEGFHCVNCAYTQFTNSLPKESRNTIGIGSLVQTPTPKHIPIEAYYSNKY